MLIFMAIGVALTALAHMWPAPFVIDWMAGERAGVVDAADRSADGLSHI